MHRKMGIFSSIFWLLLVPFCTVSYGTSIFYNRVFIVELVYYYNVLNMRYLLKHILYYIKDNNPNFVHPRNSNKIYINDLGHPPYDISFPCWYGDPTCHQKIVWVNIWHIWGKGKNKASITKCNCLRVKILRFCGEI